MSPTDVTDVFWEFCKRVATTPLGSEDSSGCILSTDEYTEMQTAVLSGRPLAIAPTPPIRMPTAIVGGLPSGCFWDTSSSSYIFTDVERLFRGVSVLLDPWATTHCRLVDRCIARIMACVSADDLADDLGGAWGGGRSSGKTENSLAGTGKCTLEEHVVADADVQ